MDRDIETGQRSQYKQLPERAKKQWRLKERIKKPGESVDPAYLCWFSSAVDSAGRFSDEQQACGFAGFVVRLEVERDAWFRLAFRKIHDVAFLF